MDTGIYLGHSRIKYLVMTLIGIALTLTLCSCSSRSHYQATSKAKDMMGGPGMKGGMGGGMPGMPGMASQVSMAKPSMESAMPSNPADSMATSSTYSNFSLMVIKTAELTIQAKHIDTAVNKAIFVVKSVGGFVESSSYNRSPDDRDSTASLTLRVPSSTFEGVLTRLGDIGKTVRKSVSGEDVTEQVFDIEARLRNKRAEEAQYVEIMQKAKRIPDIISISNELFRVREEIEKLQGRVKFLRSSADMSTISLTLTKPSQPSQPGINNAFKNAWKSLVRTSITLFSGLIWIFVYSPIWLVLAIIIWLVRRKLILMKSRITQ